MCNICGKPLTGSGSKSRNGTKYYYYHCLYCRKERFRADLANNQFAAYLNTFEIPEEILRLYRRIVEEVFNVEDEKRKHKIKQIDLEIDKVKTRIESLTDKHVDNTITDQVYTSTMSRYEHDLNELIGERTLVSMGKSTYQKYIEYGFMMLSNLGKFFQDASLIVKQKMVGSIFPDKLVFDRKNYRTAKLNLLLTLNRLKINDLDAGENKKVDKDADFLKNVVPLGADLRNKDGHI